MFCPYASMQPQCDLSIAGEYTRQFRVVRYCAGPMRLPWSTICMAASKAKVLIL